MIFAENEVLLLATNPLLLNAEKRVVIYMQNNYRKLPPFFYQSTVFLWKPQISLFPPTYSHQLALIYCNTATSLWYSRAVWEILRKHVCYVATLLKTAQEKTQVRRENPLSVQLCPPQIPSQLPWYRTHISSVTDRLVTAWVIAWQSLINRRFAIWILFPIATFI
jgi:hypothetical protein